MPRGSHMLADNEAQCRLQQSPEASSSHPRDGNGYMVFVGICILSVMLEDEQPLPCSDRTASSSSFRGTTVRKNVALQDAQHVNGRSETEINVSFPMRLCEDILKHEPWAVFDNGLVLSRVSRVAVRGGFTFGQNPEAK